MRKLWSVLLCACLALTGCGRDAVEAKEEKAPVDGSMAGRDYEHRPIGPVREPTHENYVRDVGNLLASARDSLARMEEEAAAKGAAAEPIAREAREKCEKRLSELAATDLNAQPDESLMSYMLEISNIITTLREARDAIDALP